MILLLTFCENGHTKSVTLPGENNCKCTIYYDGSSNPTYHDYSVLFSKNCLESCGSYIPKYGAVSVGWEFHEKGVIRPPSKNPIPQKN